MSSMRNAVQRRNYRERAQPLERQRWGLLEKHKDYSLRARDHASKKARLRILRQKAADRNPDEFSFAMLSTRTAKSGGKLADRGNKALSTDIVKLLKTQDAGYLRTALAQVRTERERAEQGFFVRDDDGPGEQKAEAMAADTRGNATHSAFVSRREDQLNFEPEEWFGTDTAGLAATYNRPRATIFREENEAQSVTTKTQYRAALEPNSRTNGVTDEASIAEREEQLRRKSRQHRWEKRQAQLDALKSREKALRQALQELELQRSKMNNNVGGVNKNGVTFKIKQRKR